MKPISIIGGGLAGLGLGIALRRRGVPVTLSDAGSYPRHRVCGEFIAGIRRPTLEHLGIDVLVSDATPLIHTTWYIGNRLRRRDRLPRPALSISRHVLDHRLAQRLMELGGRLHTRRRVRENADSTGTVWTTGRTAEATDWMGLKLHCFHLAVTGDLEVHLGRFGYVGASPVGNGRCNVCGLFRKRPEIRAAKSEMLSAYLRACGLTSLSDRLDHAERDPESACGVAAMSFSKSPRRSARLCLGDRYTAIPPFTGNGMSMALEAASAATGPVIHYATGKQDWTKTVADINLDLARRFRLRLAVSRAIHPLLYHPSYQRILVCLSNLGILPFRGLFRSMH